MLLKALAALHAACDIERDEIFVVDNGSTDDSPEQVAAAFPPVHLIRNPCNNGFARACNQAIAVASGEFVLLLNNDAFLAPDAIERFEAVFRTQPRAAVVAGQLFGTDGQPQHSAVHTTVVPDRPDFGLLRRRPRASQQIDGLTEVESVIGACMAVRAAAIRDAGSLDNDFFFYFEEIEWCHRMRVHGWKILVEPAAHITHLKGASTRTLRVGAQIEALRSRLIFYRKTMSPMRAFGLSAYRVLRLLLISFPAQLCLVILTLGLARRIRERFIVYAARLAWLLCGRPERWGLPDKCPGNYPGQPMAPSPDKKRKL